MTDKDTNFVSNQENTFSSDIGKKERLKIKALKRDKESVWSGLATFGMIGWSVVVPSVLGGFLGISLDRKYPQKFSWSLTLLLVGLCIGCYIAITWVVKEQKDMHSEEEKLNE